MPLRCQLSCRSLERSSAVFIWGAHVKSRVRVSLCVRSISEEHARTFSGLVQPKCLQMPKALRANTSASGNGPEGIHINFLLSVGHRLHEQSRALSTRCLERAFTVRCKHHHAILSEPRPTLPATCRHVCNQLGSSVLSCYCMISDGMQMASATGCKIPRPDVRRSCKCCFANNQNADCGTVTLSSRQISRRKSRASSRIEGRGASQAESQAMLARYSSSTVLTQQCQVSLTYAAVSNRKTSKIVA